MALGDLTPQQARVLKAFRRRAELREPPPTYRELCKEFRWASTATARDHIRALVRKGFLSPARGKPRSARLLGQPAGDVILPLVGRIEAGTPVLAEELVEEEVAVPAGLVSSTDAFALRVTGDSMEGAGILSGDLVIVARDRSPQSGDIVAVTLHGETTLKRLEGSRGQWRLVAENPRYQPIDLAERDAVIHGVVAGLIRKY